MAFVKRDQEGHFKDKKGNLWSGEMIQEVIDALANDSKFKSTADYYKSRIVIK